MVFRKGGQPGTLESVGLWFSASPRPEAGCQGMKGGVMILVSSSIRVELVVSEC